MPFHAFPEVLRSALVTCMPMFATPDVDRLAELTSSAGRVTPQVTPLLIEAWNCGDCCLIASPWADPSALAFAVP